MSGSLSVWQFLLILGLRFCSVIFIVLSIIQVAVIHDSFPKKNIKKILHFFFWDGYVILTRKTRHCSCWSLELVNKRRDRLSSGSSHKCRPVILFSCPEYDPSQDKFFENEGKKFNRAWQQNVCSLDIFFAILQLFLISLSFF